MISVLLFGLTVIATLAVIALFVRSCYKLGKTYPELRPILFSILVGIVVLNVPEFISSISSGNSTPPWGRGDDTHSLMAIAPKIIIVLLAVNAVLAIIKILRRKASN